MRIWAGICAVFVALFLILGAQAENAGKRLALVVGNGAYKYATPLPNPPEDARALGDAFADLGFEVYRVLDSDKRGLEMTLRDFGRKSAGADLAVIYFAGHGVQVNGHNYLVPVDAKLEDPRDLPYDAIPLELFLGAVADARKAGVMIVDACRDNPFVERLSARADTATEVKSGLSRIDDVPSGTLIAMATRASDVAEDGAGVHSPYAAALLTELAEPGVELHLFFGRVADDVKEATGGRQEPYVAGTLGGTPIYFNPLPPNQMPLVASGLTLEVLDSAGPTLLDIPAPTDPDKSDRLIVQVTTLPQGGLIKVFDRVVLMGDLLTVEQLRKAVFVPDGTMMGDAGSFEFLVTDGRGGSGQGSVAVFVAASNKPPVAFAMATVEAVRNPLGIQAPADPDGDPLTITVMAIPYRGRVLNGDVAVTKGDHINIEELSRLTFDPGDVPSGPVGSFEFSVDDGRGGVAISVVQIRVTERASASTSQVASVPEAATGTETVRSIGAEAVQGRFMVLKDANVRAGPSASAPRIDRIAKGSDVQVLGKAEGTNWYSVVTSSGATGFVAAELLQPAGPAATATIEPGTGEQAIETAQLTSSDSPTEKPAAVEPGESTQASIAPPSGIETSTETSSGAGTSAREFADCTNCPIMVAVPAGEFVMGNRNGDASEQPSHHVVIKPFALGKMEVTVAEWRFCVEAGGCEAIGQMNVADASTPMLNLSWDDAVAYVKWLSKRTGKPYRLPSEAEWEYAARAGTTTLYWWGDTVSAEYVSCRNCGGEYSKLSPPNPGTLPPNPFGLIDMHGGVSEWVMDCWNATYEGASDDGSAWTDGNCGRRVLRGGAWRDDNKHVTSSARSYYDHDVRYLNNGFRVALDMQ